MDHKFSFGSDPSVDHRRWAVAVHEAGHAVIPRKLGLACGEAEIWGTAETGFTGSATTHPGAVTLAAWAACQRRRHRKIEVAHRAKVMVCQSGEAAEIEIIGHCPTRTANGDRRQIAGMLVFGLHTPPLEALIVEHRLRCMTRQLVRRHRAVIAHVAEGLMERGTLSGEDIDGLVAQPV